MYYESKIIETLCLALQWDMNNQRLADQQIDRSDLTRLEEIRFYLAEHLAEPFSINELSRMACMNRSKLSDDFKQAYNTTITDYVNRLRVLRAKELLVGSDLKIAAIANGVGYKLHGSFSEAFKQHTGITPCEYRHLKIYGPKACNPA